MQRKWCSNRIISSIDARVQCPCNLFFLVTLMLCSEVLMCSSNPALIHTLVQWWQEKTSCMLLPHHLIWSFITEVGVHRDPEPSSYLDGSNRSLLNWSTLQQPKSSCLITALLVLIVPLIHLERDCEDAAAPFACLAKHKHNKVIISWRMSSLNKML